MAEFTTTEYEFSHGKRPRGRGAWAFVPANYIWPDAMPEDGIGWANGTYTDAKREIARRYPKVTVWNVLS